MNDILDFTGTNEVKEIDFLGTVWGSEILFEKENIVDVFCRDSAGQRFIVEMHLTKDKAFENRALHYTACAYSRQARKFHKYVGLKSAYLIAISNVALFEDDIEKGNIGCVSRHGITEYETHRNTIRGIQFVFVELPKFHKENVEDLENIVERWCYFFKYAEETTDEELKKIVAESPIIGKAYKELEEFRWTESQMIAYEESILRLHKEEGIWEQRLDDANRIGEERGIKLGEEKGKIEMARNLLAAGVPVDVISQSSGLSVADIKNL